MFRFFIRAASRVFIPTYLLIFKREHWFESGGEAGAGAWKCVVVGGVITDLPMRVLVSKNVDLKERLRVSALGGSVSIFLQAHLPVLWSPENQGETMSSEALTWGGKSG